MSFFSRMYGGVKRFFNDLSRAYSLRNEELRPALVSLDKTECSFLEQSIRAEKEKRSALENFNYVKEDVNKRYWSNIWRVLSGKSLVQDHESDNLGISYHNLGPVGLKEKRFVISDKEKFEAAERDLENRIRNHGSSNYGGLSASYVSSFRDDCFTNELALIGSEGSVVKGVASVLAGYVSSSSGEFVSPHKRSWKQRISELEDLVVSNNFGSRDVKELRRVKSALSKNKYLVNKKKSEYNRAVELIDKVIERKSYEK